MLKKIKFTEIEKEDWDFYIDSINIYSPHYSSWLIEYYIKFGNITNLSYILLDGTTCLAVVPLALSSKYLSFGQTYCPSPFVNKNLKESYRRKLYKYIFEDIDDCIKNAGIQRYLFSTHPFQGFNAQKKYLDLNNYFELIKYATTTKIVNTLILDLSKTKDQLNNGLSKYHRKNIKKVENKKVRFRIINSNNSLEDINKTFYDYKNEHLNSAGKITRPDETWEHMKNCIMNDKADLFFIEKDNVRISYLFCGKNKYFAFGWSQVNIDKFEKEFMPRHYLEWMAIQYYKEQKINFYELGERYYDIIKNEYSEKELSISYFKEKFGSPTYPRAYFVKV